MSKKKSKFISILKSIFNHLDDNMDFIIACGLSIILLVALFFFAKYILETHF